MSLSNSKVVCGNFVFYTLQMNCAMFSTLSFAIRHYILSTCMAVRLFVWKWFLYRCTGVRCTKSCGVFCVGQCVMWFSLQCRSVMHLRARRDASCYKSHKKVPACIYRQHTGCSCFCCCYFWLHLREVRRLSVFRRCVCACACVRALRHIIYWAIL